jgi:hypothetical protein
VLDSEVCLTASSKVSVLVFLFGFWGFLAMWGALYVPSGPSDPGDTSLFGLLNPEGQQVKCSGAAPGRYPYKPEYRI